MVRNRALMILEKSGTSALPAGWSGTPLLFQTVCSGSDDGVEAQGDETATVGCNEQTHFGGSGVGRYLQACPSVLMRQVIRMVKSLKILPGKFRAVGCASLNRRVA